MTYANPKDVWQFALDSRAISIGISHGSITRLWHEEWLYGREKSLPPCPIAVQVPDNLTDAANNARDYLLSLHPQDAMITVADIKKLMTAHAETLRKSDHTWWMTECFVLNCAYDKAINSHLQMMFLNIMPEATQCFNLTKGLVAMRHLCQSETVLAQDLCLQKDLGQAVNLLSDVPDGKGPESKVVETFTEFNKKVMKESENYLKLVWDETYGELVEGFGPSKTLNGPEAMAALLVKMNKTTTGQCPD